MFYVRADVSSFNEAKEERTDVSTQLIPMILFSVLKGISWVGRFSVPKFRGQHLNFKHLFAIKFVTR